MLHSAKYGKLLRTEPAYPPQNDHQNIWIWMIELFWVMSNFAAAIMYNLLLAKEYIQSLNYLDLATWYD